MNVLVDSDSGSKITGIIDFGDSACTKRYFNLSIALCYYILYAKEPIRCACNMVSGYLESVKLTNEEMKLIYVRISLIFKLCLTTILFNTSHALLDV